MVELWGQNSLNGGTRRKRGRRQRGGLGYAPLYTQGGSRRNRGRSQRGGGTRRNRGRSQRGGQTLFYTHN